MSDNPPEQITKQMVEEAIEEKIKNYRRIVIAFFLGFGLLFIFLVSQGLIAKEALIVQLHNAIFGIDLKKEIEEYLSKEVAVSYNAQFWLDPTRNYQHVMLHVTEEQTVDLFIEVFHSGGSEVKGNVLIQLSPSLINPSLSPSKSKIHSSNEDYIDRWDLTDNLDEIRSGRGEKDMYILSFFFSFSGDGTGTDEVYIKALANAKPRVEK